MGASPSPPGALGLRYFTIVLPNRKALDEVNARIDQAAIPANQTEKGWLISDPSQNGVMLSLKTSEY